MRILTKYITNQVGQTFVAITLVITLVLAGGNFLNSLNKAYELGIPADILIYWSLLQLFFSFETLLPLAIFLAIIIVITRLYQDSEIVVLSAAGVSEWQIIKMALPIILFVCFLVGIFSLELAPWSYKKSGSMLNNIGKSVVIKAGKFQEFDNLMFYTVEVSQDNKQMKDIFAQIELDGEQIVIVAKKAKQYVDKKTKDIYLKLENGKRYFGFNNKGNKYVMRFSKLDIRIYENKIKSEEVKNYNVRIEDNIDLLASSNIKAIAELQWRLSKPISVLLLSVLAILLGKVSSRQTNGTGMFVGILILAVYNNLLVFAKTQLETNITPSYLGMWWVHLLLLFIIYLIIDFRYKLRVSQLFK